MITITVLDKKTEYKLSLEDGQSIMSALIQHDKGISAFCGGKGICGKCRIRLLEGEILPSSEDMRFFDSKQLEQGYRLACTAYPTENCKIQLCMEKEQEIKIITKSDYDSVSSDRTFLDNMSTEFGIAVDIGTTTIAMQLVGKEKREVVSTHTCLNPQRSYGADVISRIQAANTGERKELQKKICDTLITGFDKLILDAGIETSGIKEVIVSANTTMIHLLLGYPCETLGVSPFTPVNIDTVITNSKEIFPDSSLNCAVKILPGISSFVGADIVSGLYVCDFMDDKQVNLFIDLGTNGEMAIGNGNKIFATSVAAGPAFEGGNISWGTGSIPGAICRVELDLNHKVKIGTIGDEEPVGICGTGVIEIVSTLLQAELIDETGLLDDDYFETGYELTKNRDGQAIVITQKDIREIQLAKAAVRAGIEVLLNRFDASYEEIQNVYLAGGFGYHASIEKMIAIGMIPKELKNKVKAVGNTSLSGAKKLLFSENDWEKLESIKINSQEMNLAMDMDFQLLYVENINFDK